MTPAMDDLLARVRPLVMLLDVLGVAHAAVASPTQLTLVKVRSDSESISRRSGLHTRMGGLAGVRSQHRLADRTA